ncbi:undecaprenyl-diphosphate phosphatase [Lichenihabitans sp. Uapishka_5]|uniref:undecaprenyl-diphosphate phosphatase n=1 Tax=Lichenihabitans sp. Uapishka_5 TaxID=3037302 RepID=UPI0029E7F116|nr:undecaprenyl-diphosphate phosphatase [Lichenihabitans sp. Uapishka_5]MDX7952651.1 undecaprenyl-diphosphate phosphatase [Lichenihabitans sp. Uapishka_5]
MDLLNTILLGIIEGVTEFLPISSTGHLLIAEHWLGARSDMFNVVIQAGAILAVTVIYWRKLMALALNWRVPAVQSYIGKLVLAFLITGVLGLLAKKLGFKLPETITPIAWAMLIGGFWILGAEAVAARQAPRTDVSWFTATVVGLAQIVAGLLPGTSRSGATIFAAMLSGTSNRAAATEFSFLVGIPTMYAASLFELHDQMKAGAAHEPWSEVALAFVVATITAFVSVKWLLRYIQSHRFTAFAAYRIVFGLVLLGLAASGKGPA